MAPRHSARASRARVSYREPSFQSDDARDASYSSDPGDGSDNAAPAPAEPAGRTTRHSTRRAPRLRKSLREPSSEEDVDDFIDDDESDDDLQDGDTGAVVVLIPPAKRRRTNGAQRNGAAPARPARAAATRPPRKRKVATANSTKSAPRETRIMETDGLCPPWESLPAEIIMAVFDFAYWKIEDGKKANGWLVGAARTCRAFAKPALETLYKAPRFSSSRQIDQFTIALSAFHRRPESGYLDYLSKVKCLSLDERMLHRSFDIVALINILPSLVDVDIWSSKDTQLRGAYHETESYVPYRPEQWEKLDPSHRPLRSWHWNEKMGRIREICKLHHGYPIFSKLKRLTATHFDIVSKGSAPSYLGTILHPLPPLKGQALDEALRWIPSEEPDESLPPPAQAGTTLEAIRFEFCSSLAADFYVPRENLRTLEIHCCDNVDSDGLAACLAVSGAQLRTLVLDHNRSLNLEFLQTLGASCPRLATLSMNLLYFARPIEALAPEYDALMDETHAPRWPPDLESLSLQHLRRWTAEGAAALFRSIEREPFPRLRALVVSASVDLPWQTRASFRDEWLARFDRAFRRPPAPPPSRHLVSLKAFRLSKAARARKDVAREEGGGEERGNGGEAGGRGTRRPRRRAAAYGPGALADGSDDDDDGGVDGAARASALTSRVRSVLGPAAASGSDGGGDGVPTERRHRRGLCDVVDVRIDNARPREHEYRESDMLDSEESGDSDYPVE